MKKIYDVSSMFETYGEYDICKICYKSEEYYESDTGYSEMICTIKDDDERFCHCQRAIKDYLIENNLENSEEEVMNNETVKGNEITLTMDIENLKNSIIKSVKKELKEDITKELKESIIRQVYDEIAKPQLDKIKTTISDSINELVSEEVKSFYTEQKISIGGGWNEPVITMTIREYTQTLLKDIIAVGKVKMYGGNTVLIDKYILENAITAEVQKYMSSELTKVQKGVDVKVKEVFNTKIEQMMSEVALGVLKSNATYNEITQKLLG